MLNSKLQKGKECLAFYGFNLDPFFTFTATWNMLFCTRG